jgi:multidrug efflux pump subunit AcrA (membrane-fusion protein)
MEATETENANSTKANNIEANIKPAKRKRKIFAAVFIIITVFNVTFHLVMRGRTGSHEAQAVAEPVFSVRSESAEVRTLQAYLEVNANIVSGHQVAVLPDAAGRLVSMRVELGQAVQAGALLAQVDPSRPGAQFALSSVYAPVSGMVVQGPLTVGSTVTTGTTLMTLAVANTIEIEALIPEREVGQLRTGLTAEIRLEAFPGETFSATLTQVAPVLDPVSRTRRIIMRFNQNDPRITSGMFARVRLNTRTYTNVVSIPQDALVEHRGRTIVFVLVDDDAADAGASANVPAAANSPAAQMREVTVGVTVDREVEIQAGLTAGEEVVVQGQQFLADGAKVRVIGRRL